MSNQIERYIAMGIRMSTNQLTTPELIAIYNAATTGSDPRGVMGYEKAKGLFTEANGTRMHEASLALMDSIVAERLRMEQNKGQESLTITSNPLEGLPPLLQNLQWDRAGRLLLEKARRENEEESKQ